MGSPKMTGGQEIELKPFTNATLDDAKYVVRSVFGENACNKLETIIRNPALEEVPGSDCGEVLYIDGKPAGFNAAVLRKVYYKNIPFWGISGSTLCLLPEARKEMACVDLMKKIVAPRFGSKMFFGNSANKKGLRITHAFGIDGRVPDTTAHKRIAVVRPFLFALYLLRSKVLKIREYSPSRRAIDYGKAKEIKISGFCVKVIESCSDGVFDSFWADYLATNKGYVCSRSTNELKWLWQERLVAGRILAAGAYLNGALRGYVVFAADVTGRAWHVFDLIAIDNDRATISATLCGGLKLLKQITPATHCDVTGFPDFVQPAIAKSFRIRRNLSNNQFTWKFHASDGPTFEELNSKNSWFFGPYDGDICM